MRQQALVLSFAVVLVFLHVSEETRAGIITITTASGHGGDATIRQPSSNAEQNYGGANVIEVHRITAPFTRPKKGYLRFDLSALSDNAHDFISLNLNFQAISDFGVPSRSFNLYGLLDVSHSNYQGGDQGEDWREGPFNNGEKPFDNEITWQSAPANNKTSPTDFGPGAVLLGTFTVSNVGLLEITDGLLSGGIGLKNFINADTNRLITFMISAHNGDWSSTTSSWITSHEGANEFNVAPTIVYQQSVPTTQPQHSPEPSTLAMCIVGAALGAAGQRQRALARRRQTAIL